MARNHSPSQHDVVIIGQRGDTVFLLCPTSDLGSEWLDEHIAESVHHLGRNPVVEHRYVRGIIEGMDRDGLRLVFSR